MPSVKDRPVVLAQIVGASGVRGDVRLRLYADSVESFGQHRQFDVHLPPGRVTDVSRLELVALRAAPAGKRGVVLARFAEIADRTLAEGLRGAELSVPRAALPPLAPGEIYWHDLVGRAAVLPDGSAAGVVQAVENYGASDILVIAMADGREVLVPLIPAAVTLPEPDDGDSPLQIGADWLQP